MKLSLLTPNRKLLTEEPVEGVTLTSSEGLIEILPGHAPMLGSLETGAFAYKKENSNEAQEGFISTGFFEVSEDHVKVTADTLELDSEIDLDRAKEAQRKAEEALKDPQIDEKKFRKYQLKLQRSVVRQQLRK